MKPKTNRNYNKLPSQTQTEQKLTKVELKNPYAFPRSENNLHFTEKNTYVLTFITLINQIILTF